MARKKSRAKKFYRRASCDGPSKDNKHKLKLMVKRDDIVEVISGVDKGKRGKILRTIPEEYCVVVQGVNRKWKHLRRSQDNPQGGRIEHEFPIPQSKVRKVEG